MIRHIQPIGPRVLFSKSAGTKVPFRILETKEVLALVEEISGDSLL